MKALLAVDLGKTGCRAALWTGPADAPAAVHEAAGAPGLAQAGGVAAAEAAVLAAAAPLLAAADGGAGSGGGPLAAVCVGAAGAAAAPDAARELAERLLAALPAEEAAVASDAVTAHAGALGGGPGVVLAAGTGVVAVAVGADGALALVDGWGPWLGDEGGGAWIGLAALRAALRAHDGRGPDTALREAAADRFGPLPGLPAVLGREANPARTAASFAPAVARAAADGDPVADGILREAAEALAGAVAAAARRSGGAGPVPVALTGGLLRLGAPLTEPLGALLDRCDPPLRLREALGDPLAGARVLAAARDTPHEASVVRLRRPAGPVRPDA
ncbi:BadF/BadG/BcrA/BcrD ATPase family protein [Streptomyces sp. NPDC001380]|uniref:BadF/BadG/BcrA/BcrD ATPase family protein n=1 Tax=Streptomyces sp. NPDC001380 TaxID=3364566 RepID=UPI0036BFF072